MALRIVALLLQLVALNAALLHSPAAMELAPPYFVPALSDLPKDKAADTVKGVVTPTGIILTDAMIDKAYLDASQRRTSQLPTVRKP